MIGLSKLHESSFCQAASLPFADLFKSTVFSNRRANDQEGNRIMITTITLTKESMVMVPSLKRLSHGIMDLNPESKTSSFGMGHPQFAIQDKPAALGLS